MAFDNKVIHTVVETTNVQATKWAEHIYSMINEVDDLDNGSIGFVGEIYDDTNDTYEFVKPTTALIAEGNPVMAIHPNDSFNFSILPEADEDQYFYNAKGDKFRAYTFMTGDKINISSTGITPLNVGTGVVVGNYVTLTNASYKLTETATKPTDKFYAKIEAINKYPFYVHDPMIKDNQGNVIIQRLKMIVLRIHNTRV